MTYIVAYDHNGREAGILYLDYMFLEALFILEEASCSQIAKHIRRTEVAFSTFDILDLASKLLNKGFIVKEVKDDDTFYKVHPDINIREKLTEMYEEWPILLAEHNAKQKGA